VGAQDEATFGLIPIIQRGWAKKGSKPFVKISHSNECNLEKLRCRWGKFLLFTDNYKPHKGGIVEDYLKNHKKTVKVSYFLKYSPELNPVEPCWKPGRKVLANRIIPSLNAVKYHLRKTFRDKKSIPKMFEYLRD